MKAKDGRSLFLVMAKEEQLTCPEVHVGDVGIVLVFGWHPQRLPSLSQRLVLAFPGGQKAAGKLVLPRIGQSLSHESPSRTPQKVTRTHNADFARGFVQLWGDERAIGEAFHITTDALLRWSQI